MKMSAKTAFILFCVFAFYLVHHDSREGMLSRHAISRAGNLLPTSVTDFWISEAYTSEVMHLLAKNLYIRRSISLSPHTARLINKFNWKLVFLNST